MFIIGIDPHKGSHMAAVVDSTERVIDQVRVRADRQQRDRLLTFAARFEPRCWAVEGAAGVGALGLGCTGHEAVPPRVSDGRSRCPAGVVRWVASG